MLPPSRALLLSVKAAAAAKEEEEEQEQEEAEEEEEEEQEEQETQHRTKPKKSKRDGGASQTVWCFRSYLLLVASALQLWLCLYTLLVPCR